MENKPRKLTLCSFYNNTGYAIYQCPIVQLRGKWLQAFGFQIGDQITISNPEPGAMSITVTKTAKVRALERKRKEKEAELRLAGRRRNAA